MTEHELQNLAWRDRASFAPFVDGWERSRLFKEYRIAGGLRPDFVQFGIWYGTPTIWIHEFKLRGLLRDLDQLTRYQRLFGEHCEELTAKLYHAGRGIFRSPKVKTSLVALGFEPRVHEVATATDTWLWAVKAEANGYVVEQEYHFDSIMAGSSTAESQFLDRLLADYFLPFRKEAEVIEEAKNGEAVH